MAVVVVSIIVACVVEAAVVVWDGLSMWPVQDTILNRRTQIKKIDAYFLIFSKISNSLFRMVELYHYIT